MSVKCGLTHTQMKLGRGYVHLEQLCRDIAVFIAGDPYTVRGYDDPENSLYVMSIEPATMPDSIGILSGEFAFQLRSSLDNLIWQLALLNGRRPDRSISFPILSKPDPKIFQKRTAGISREARKIIESLQPYHRGAAYKSHPLWMLNQLCNLDKHREIAVSCLELTFTLFKCSPPLRKNLYDRVEVSVPISEKSEVDLRVESIRVKFGEPIDGPDAVSGFEIPIEALAEIYEFVRYNAVPAFERFFAEEARKA